MKKYWFKLSNLGVTNEDDQSEKMRKRLLNQVLGIALFFCFLTVLSSFFYTSPIISVIGFLVTSVFCSALILNYYSKHHITRHFTVILMFVVITSLSYFYGNGFNNYLFYLNAVTLVFFLMKSSRTRLVYFVIALVSICFTIHWSQQNTSSFEQDYINWLSLANGPLALLIQLALLNFYSNQLQLKQEIILKKQLDLQKNESKFRSIFENNQLGIVVSGADLSEDGGALIFKDANPAFCNMLGYTLEEVMQMNSSDVSSPEQREHTSNLAKSLSDKEIEWFSLEKDYTHKDGSVIHAITTVSGIYDDDGKFQASVATITDITKEHQAKQQLADSEAKFKLLFEKSPYPIVLLDYHGAIDCNQAAIDFLEYPKEELMKKGALDCSPEFQLDGTPSIDLKKILSKNFKSSNFFSFEWYIQKKKGELVPTDVALSRVKHKGKETFIAILNDLSEQKQNELKIQELLAKLRIKNSDLEGNVKERTKELQILNSDLIRSNKDLEQFAYVASHDLQEPLRMVGNFVQLLDQDYTDIIDEEGKSYIRFAVDGVSRMSKLIRELLQFSRVGRKEVSMKNTNIDLLVSKKLLDLGQRIKETKTEIETHNLPEKILCEPNQIGIVFYNLIGNAIKFNKSTSPIINIAAEDKGNQWLFKISDNGIGIANEHQDRIFKIFQRLHRKEDYEGTGIGLSLCRKIICRHKGKIWVDSKIGEGATFYFTIDKDLQNEQLQSSC